MAERISVKPVLDVFPKPTLAERLRRFPLIFGGSVLVLLVALTLFYRNEEHRLKADLIRDEAARLRTIRFVIARDLQSIGADLLALAGNESLADYLRHPSSFNRMLATGRFKSFARERRFYSQVRFLDVAGNEVIRVNHDGETVTVVPPSGLQNKGGRYYFSESIRLEPGKIFVSPLDLNVERGEIERPLVPTMRFGTPVIDESGRVRGVVLLNLRARILLDRFKQLYPEQSNSRFWIVNRDGYWLKADHREREWGFMLEHKETVSRSFPKLWQAIAKGQSLYTGSDGVYSITRLFPEKEIDTFSPERRGQLVWHLVLQLPADRYGWQAVLAENLHLAWLLFPLMLLMVGGSCYLSSILSLREKMQEALTLLATGVEQSPAAVVITDPEGYIRYANPKFERMTGYDRKSILGEHTRLFKSGATKEAVYRALWKTILDGRIWKGDFENRHKNGHSYYVLAQIAPIFNRSGGIDSFLALQEDITEKKRLERELEAMATRDGLTGISNRNHFLHQLDQELTRSNRYGQPLAILSFDLDYFKDINDTYGHHAGDEVLKGFARIVDGQLRDNDIFGRLGGEEFAAALVGADRAGAEGLAERLRGAVESLVVESDGQAIRVTVSIGLTLWKEGETEGLELLKRADKALYIAKNGGRNRVASYF